MDVVQVKKAANPFKPKSIFWVAMFCVVLVCRWKDTEMSFRELFIEGWPHMVSYIVGNPTIPGSSFFPPRLVPADLKIYLFAMLETLEMAFVALCMSLFISFPLSFLISRNILEILFPGSSAFIKLLRRVIYLGSMLLANVCRSINEIVWALLFVSAVGLGPMAGILALGLHTAGVLTKLLAEGNEAIDPGPVEALSATGAGFIKIIIYAVMPQTMPHFVSMVLYRFESDVRSAAVLGLVGAGGIGFYLFDKVRSFENGDVTTIIIIIVTVVWIIDKLSATIRKKFI